MPPISRRDLLIASSGAALALTAGRNGALAAAGAGEGRICLGLSGLTYYSGVYPLLNAWKQGARIQVVANGVDYFSDISPGLPNSAWGAFLDGNGELVRPLPAGVTALTRIFVAPPGDGFPPGSQMGGEDWVLKWDGAAREATIAGARIIDRSANRAVWQWPSGMEESWVSFAGIDANDPPRNVRLCPARHEPRLDAGEIFNPDWLEIIRQGSGIVRFMDWQGTNNNRSTLRFADIPGEDYCSYGGSTETRFIKGGMPLRVMSELASQVGSHPWVCIPHLFGTEKFSIATKLENANPTIVHAPGHQWRDGDRVIVYGTGWQEIDRRAYKVVRADQAAGTFALAGADASGLQASNMGSVTSPYDLAAMAAEIAPMATHFRDSVEAPLVTYFEFGNELWNWLFSSIHWLAAQARHKLPDDDSYKMSGYLAAHCMNVVRQTYGAEKRRRWRGVLATFTVLPDVTERMIEGANLYIKENEPGVTLTDLFNDVAVTGYWGEGFTAENQANVFAMMDRSEARWRDGAESSKYSHFNRMVNLECARALKETIGYWEKQKKVASSHRLGLIQYEGGNHQIPYFAASLPDAELKRFIEFYRNCNHTPEDAANYRTMFSMFLGVGGRFPSKFVEMAPVSRYGAWGGLRYMGDSNPVWNEVITFNRRT